MKLSFTKDYHFFTVQGEGIHTGIPAIFLRLSGCNLRCEWRNEDGGTSLCDTPYSSHQPEKLIKDVEQVVSDIGKYPCKYVVITGGEPFLQKNMASLVSALKDKGYYICIETNGSLFFKTKADFISMSPKLSTSCVDSSEHFDSHQKKRFSLEAMTNLIENHDFQLKYVVNTEEDLEEIKQQVYSLRNSGLKIPDDKVLLMPQAVTKKQLEEKSEKVIEWARNTGHRFCDRMHIRVWGDKRGV